MDQRKLTSCLLVVLLFGSLIAVSTGQLFQKRRQRKSDESDAENRRVCWFMSRVFVNRGCMEQIGVVCRMLNFMITMGGYDCEQFPCQGYGHKSRSSCVQAGTCNRLILSNGLCTTESECCIEGQDRDDGDT